MAAFANVDPALRRYFQKHLIPDVYEALLGGLLVMCPEDPLLFLEEKIKAIMEKGLHNVLWNMCIDPAIGLKIKAISDTYLHTLLGLEDDQLMTSELCDKAWIFYTSNLKRMCFDAWINFCALKKHAEGILRWKLNCARRYHDLKLVKIIIKEWRIWVVFRKEQNKRAAARISKVFNNTLQKLILKAWQKQALYNLKAKKCIVRIESGPAEVAEVAEAAEVAEVTEVHVEVHQLEEQERQHPDKRQPRLHFDDHALLAAQAIFRDSALKSSERAINQVFHYLDLADLGACAQVNHSWYAMTQTSSLWSRINFSATKHKIRDRVAGNILFKWRTNVLHLNLRGCSTLQWLTFKSIGQCKNLQVLNVSECQGLNDELMRLVSEGCPALLSLNLSHTDITNGTLRLLSRSFSNLQYLNLAYCRKFTDKGLQYLGSGRGCHKLIYLDLSGCLQISVEGFRNIANSCSKVQYLTINEMPTLTDRCIQVLAGKCKQIVSIEFNECPHISDAAFKALAECNLVKVKIEGSNRITDLSFRLMSKSWPCLQYICLADCQKITDSGLKQLANQSDIVALNLSDCMRINDAGIKVFVEGSSGAKIRELTLANCSSVTDVALIKIAQRCPNLVYLNLRYCQAVTDTGVEAVATLSSLNAINISGVDITDQALDALGKHGRIKEITVAECKMVSDSGIQKLCNDQKYLDYIDFSYCKQLSNQSLKHLAFNCHRLTTLSMAGCPRVTDIGIQFLAAVCTYLHYLDISGCILLTDKALRALWKGSLQLRILKMLYCTNITRQAVLKYTTKLRKYEYNDDDPPMWFGYSETTQVPTPKKKKKQQTGVPAEAK